MYDLTASNKCGYDQLITIITRPMRCVVVYVRRMMYQLLTVLGVD